MQKLKIGDKITCTNPENVDYGFTGEAIFRGKSTYTKNKSHKFYALERLDNATGGAQNGWWNYPTTMTAALTIIKTAKPPKQTLSNLNSIKKALKF